MKVSCQRLPDSQVVLEIQVEPERLERSLERAYRRLVQRAAIPGFRKGKAPRAMLERHLGRERLLQEALDILVPEVYNQALEEQQIEAIDLPQIELLQREPPIIKATVPVRPTVELGDYRSLRVEREAVEVPPQEVEAALRELQHRYAIQEPVERPVQVGDIVRADVRGVVEGRQVLAEEDAEFRLRQGATILLPGFAEALLGAEKGVSKQVSLEVPPDYPQRSLAGKTCIFTVLVKEIKQERLPELDDEFAREVGEGFPSLTALRQRLEADLRERRQAEAEENYRQKAVEALVEQAEQIEFPPVLVEREIDRLLREEARAAGQDVERYLEQMRKPLAEVREELRPQARERVRRSLALTKLAEGEGITVSPEDIDSEVDRMAMAAGPQGEQLRRLFGNPNGRQAIERSLLTRYTLDRLTAIVSGQEVPPRTVELPEKSAKVKEEAKE